MSKQEQNCGNCDAFYRAPDLKVKKGTTEYGTCRRNPPFPVQVMKQTLGPNGAQMVPDWDSVFPPTNSAIWCGQWRAVWERNARVIEHERPARLGVAGEQLGRPDDAGPPAAA